MFSHQIKIRKGLSRRAFMELTGAGSLLLSRSKCGVAEPLTLGLSPFLARPTADSLLVNWQNGPVDADALLEVRRPGGTGWSPAGPARQVEAGEFLNSRLENLEPATSYDYRLKMALRGGEPAPLAGGRFVTQRFGETSFSAALISDAHTGSFANGTGPPEVLDEVVRNVRRERPDFVIALGDNVAWATSGDLPQEDQFEAIWAYTQYRQHLAPLSHSCPHFSLIGNWEGESGKFPGESIALIAEARKQFSPNPNAETYRWGGSPQEDYYAFDWGPALSLILNVQTYTIPSAELATPRDDVAGLEDWTLGRTQFAWLEKTLGRADHPYLFICIHHAVGGAGGNKIESLYGRGGPRAAAVGEQRLVHELMREYGVQIFFYGHDHVFVDELRDGIHYSLPGSCGAPWKFGREVTGYGRFWPDSGHASLTVRPDRATVKYVSQVGRVLHQFQVRPRA